MWKENCTTTIYSKNSTLGQGELHTTYNFWLLQDLAKYYWRLSPENEVGIKLVKLLQEKKYNSWITWKHQ